MNTRVIILAQGEQKRLPNLAIAKQMLPLPACDGTPILYRTLRQLWHLMGGIGVDAEHDHEVVVVAWYPLMEQLIRTPVIVKQLFHPSGAAADWKFSPKVDSLADPGNSSLKGIARYLRNIDANRADRTVVLLGDVVYSWNCLYALLRSFTDEPPPPLRFVGTSDISPSGGELWGIAWHKDAHDLMETALYNALEKHPPFTDYQPGQLRRWMWAMHPKFETTNKYVRIDDYTIDIDVPAHVEAIGAISVAAAADDADATLRHPVKCA